MLSCRSNLYEKWHFRHSNLQALLKQQTACIQIPSQIALLGIFERLNKLQV